MTLDRTAALALVLLAGCGPNLVAVNAANQRAEAAASRAEVVAAAAEAAADGAFKSCYRTNRTLIETERSLINTKDYIDRFGMWEKLRKLPQHRDPWEAKPGTILPDGSIAATFMEALTVSPHAYDHSPAEDPRDREDDDHAQAVMNCHPELRNLPKFMGVTIGGDGVTKTKDGRDATFIMVEIDDSDTKDGLATLSKAKAAAPAFVEDVPVTVSGISGAVFYAQ